MKVVFVFVCISSVLSNNTSLVALLWFLCLDDSTPEQKEEFLREIEQMKRLGSHQNIVSMVGCCTLREHKFLVIEYVPFGDELLQWLRRAERRSVGNLVIKYCFVT